MNAESVEAEIQRLAEGQVDEGTLQRLAQLYIIRDHMKQQLAANDDSELARLVNGKDPAKVWRVIAEMFETVRAIQPRLYQAAIDKIEAIE